MSGANEEPVAGPFVGGPYVAVAVFCEHALEERDGMLSVIRIYDRLNHVASGTSTPAQMPPVYRPMTLVLMLRSGAARGRHDVSVIAERPSGIRTPIAEAISFNLEGEERAANLILNLGLTFSEEGLYWFDVAIDGQLATRVPLRTVYQRQQTFAPPSG